MPLGSRPVTERTFRRLGMGLSLIAFTALSTVFAQGQTRDLRPAEQVFKNVQALKGIPADEFMSTMGFFSACSASVASTAIRRRAAAIGRNTPMTLR